MAASPGPEAHELLKRIDAAIDAGRIDQAIAFANQALQRGIKSTVVLNVAAFGEELRGRFDRALAYLGEAEKMAPRDVLVLSAIGRCLSKQGRAAMARTAFERAIAEHPNHAPAHHGLGAALAALGDTDAAYASQKRSAELDPNFPAPLGALAELSLHRGEKDVAWSYAERAVRLEPLQPMANLVLATLDAKAGRRDAAIARMEKLHAAGGLAPLHEANTQRLLADQLDAAGRTAEAFRAYTAANQCMWQIMGADLQKARPETGRDLCRRLNTYFKAADPADWRPAGGDTNTAASGHVFLIGFVRSGTTLLEQVLASHPKIVALEEKATVRPLSPSFFTENAGLDRLSKLSGEEANALRQDYWKRVAAYGVDVAGKIFVDKQPLLTPWLPIVAKLFPDAKIIFARRDPRDVVLSSFRHAFRVNALTAAFVDLAEIAHFYDEMMSLAKTYREKLAIPTHIHQHEAMVRDFDTETKAVCDFLGIAWDPAMRAFAETAKRRDVRTPSAEQVRRGLYSSGMAQWRRYEMEMAPAMPILQPWIERFGYADS